MEASSCLRLFICARCGRQVLVCSKCDHGNIYCSSTCSKLRRKESVARAGKTYQRTLPGARYHAARQEKYRARKKIVTHQGSLLSLNNASSSEQEPEKDLAEISKVVVAEQRRPTQCCHFCGFEGNCFIRLDYTKRKRSYRGILQL